MKAFFNVIAILAVGLSHIFTAIAVNYIGRVLASFFEDMDADLPLISQITINYTATTWPLYLGVAAGVGSVVVLFAISRSEKLGWLLPFLIAASFVAALLHLAFVSLGMAVPFGKILTVMSQ